MASVPTRRPPPWMRALYRAPLHAYRAGLAGREHWFGLSWVLIETFGRKTGRPHRVLVDRIGEAAAERRFFMQSAYGDDSDWVRNARANPRLFAEVRGNRFPARLETVDDVTARRIMSDYVHAHRIYSPFIAWMLGYRGRLAEPEVVASWLVDNFGMLAIVAKGAPPG